jgi:Protein of unknown function (DUF2628)
MAIYTVLAPRADGDGALDPMSVVFVKEGFCWPALFVAVPWLIFRRMWLVLVGYIVVAMVVSAAGSAVGPLSAGVAIVILHFLFALEANELRRWTLARRGYSPIGILEAHGLEEAEIRYFAAAETAVDETPAPPAPPVPPARPALGMIQPSAEAGDVVGLFPAPGSAL